jgi:hypothetical protein
MTKKQCSKTLSYASLAISLSFRLESGRLTPGHNSSQRSGWSEIWRCARCLKINLIPARWLELWPETESFSTFVGWSVTSEPLKTKPGFAIRCGSPDCDWGFPMADLGES